MKYAAIALGVSAVLFGLYVWAPFHRIAQGFDRPSNQSLGQAQIIYVGATWCPFCPAQRAKVERLKPYFKTTFLDLEKDAAQVKRLQVSRVPTVLIVASGQIVKRLEGRVSSIRIALEVYHAQASAMTSSKAR